MNVPSPPLLPLLRSENQLRILAAVMLEPTRRFSVKDLVEQTGVPQPSVSREVAALLRAGLAVAATERGRRLISADVESPIFPEVSSLVRKSAGPVVVLTRHLTSAVRVTEAHVYGSWARRASGEPGPVPSDIDVVVVGDVDVDDVRDRAEAAGREMGREVSVSILSDQEWEEPSSGFVRHLRDSPLITLLHRDGHRA